MKATGIVRRIDDLGRVVIPKEIRRTMRIREGDPLEIYTDREGEVILKKYSPIGELSEYAAQYAESIYKTSGHTAFITDKDQVVAVSGAAKKDYLDKAISAGVEKIIQEKRFSSLKGNDAVVRITDDSPDTVKFSSQIIAPIVSEGDPVGAVIMMSSDTSGIMGETEEKIARMAAGVLGKQI